jgi:hypothetical protein
LLNTNRWPLLAAARQGEWDKCEQLLDEGTPDPRYIRYIAAVYPANAGQARLLARLQRSAQATGMADENERRVWGVRIELAALEEALQYAALAEDFPISHMLLDFLLMLLDTTAEEAVYKAACNGLVKVVELWLNACQHHSQQCYQLLYPNLFKKALEGVVGGHGNVVEILTFLLSKGLDVNGGQTSFTEDRPLATAMDEYNLEAMQFFLNHGAHVHADPTRLKSQSALSYAARYLDPERCELLLSHTAVTVGGAELCAAVEAGCVPVLELLLRADSKLTQSLREDEEERGEWLARALVLAVQCSPEATYACSICGQSTLWWQYDMTSSWDEYYEPRDNEQIIRALLAPPAHWYPLPHDLLSEGVRAVTRLVLKHKANLEPLASTIAAMIMMIRMFAKAGADLNLDDGALLKAAWRSNNKELLEALVECGVDIQTPEGTPGTP